MPALNPVFLLRLVFDFTAAGLLLAGLAYWWLDNTAHELIGTGMFMLLIAHNVFNRRWYGTLARTRREPRSLITVILNLSLLAVMLALLITSLMISRTVFGFLQINAGFSVRQIHTLAAYWVLVIAALHLGLHWSIVMTAARTVAGITGPSMVRTTILRMIAMAIAIYGIYSSFQLGIGGRLIAEISMDFWDFNASTLGFFTHLAAIVGLYAGIAHYTVTWLRRLKRVTQHS